ncbi:MAG: dUTP diphosphatase [Ignavibacteriae bacterium HGW-Ignavibacteriae-2]|jgi:dUTP pyrophosphatase|nr:dUTP diphosphatase [Bacteroidota bacterium]PKL87560.1 MAG: dUTP diphosphatase [Ignavibacteriae bacterium HGW-Ignavibacteriae-2]
MNSIDNKNVYIKRISKNFNDIPLPVYATEGSAGADIRAAVENEIVLGKGEIKMIPTNLMIEIPAGYELQVRPRSGLAAKYGVGILNSPGTIDSDYRGEVKVILFNFGQDDFIIKRGDRIAQLVLNAYSKMDIIETNILNESSRGEGGFGHTGKS